MTNYHERIYALLVEANPVKDPEQAREIIDRRRRLTLVKPRRRPMTDPHATTNRADSGERPRWLVPFSVAAALVLFVGVVTAIVAFDSGDESDEPSTNPAASTTAAPTPTTAAAPTTAPPTTAVPTTPAPTTTVVETTTTTTEPPPPVTPEVLPARVTVDADGCRYDGPPMANVGDTLAITLENNTERHVFLDVYRFIPGSSTEDLPALAADPARALDAVYTFGFVEVWMQALTNSTSDTVYLDPDSSSDTGAFVLERESNYGFICWSAPGGNPNFIDGGSAAADGFSVVPG